uniref:Ribbon-helix-helix protein, CopG family n=1 Tax=Muribaculaceae bacterium Z82 TaxID=2304548 RepID=A0A7C9NRQ8_9BACT
MAGCAETRLPVTMRLPRREVELVSEYAQEAGVTRTEAFLHFLRLGLQVDDSSERLASIEQSVEEILRCVAVGKPASVGFAAAKAADGGGLEEGEEIRL